MAVTLSLTEFATATHSGSDSGITIETKYAAVVAYVEERAPNAPEAIQNQAAVLLGGRLLYPTGTSGIDGGYDPTFLGTAWFSCGASMLTKPWAKRRAAKVS